MSDELKKYIDFNRDGLELYPFDTKSGWEELSKKLNPPRHRNIVWYVAASVVMLLGLTILAYSPDQGNKYISEIQETQVYYQDMIDSKLNLVKTQIDDEQLLYDLEQLDVAFAELTTDLKDNAQNEEVVQAMIDNYRLKLKILERILEDLDEGKDEKDSSI